MEKALEILRETLYIGRSRQGDDFDYIVCGKIKDAIKKLEEAMKPKACLSCVNCNKDYQLMSNPSQYELKCGVFKTVFVNDFKQYCSRYEPK